MHVRTVAGAVRALLLAEGLFAFAAYAALGLLELLAVARYADTLDWPGAAAYVAVVASIAATGLWGRSSRGVGEVALRAPLRRESAAIDPLSEEAVCRSPARPCRPRSSAGTPAT